MDLPSLLDDQDPVSFHGYAFFALAEVGGANMGTEFAKPYATFCFHIGNSMGLLPVGTRVANSWVQLIEYNQDIAGRGPLIVAGSYQSIHIDIP